MNPEGGGEHQDDIPEFTKDIDSKPITKEEAQKAEQSWQSEMDNKESLREEDREAEKLERRQNRRKVVTGVVATAAVIGGGGVLAPKIISHLTEVKIDDGAYLSGLKEKSPKALENVIQNKTIEAVGQENWDKMSSEERLKATGEMSKNVNKVIEEYRKEHPVQTNSEGSISGVTTEDGTEYRVDLPPKG
jgi:hypothetical protein